MYKIRWNFNVCPRVSALVVALAALFSAAPVLPSEAGQTYLSAEACGACHIDTYESWVRTIHALAAIDPVFVEALERSRETGGREAEKSCLSCHSPTTVLTGDIDLELPVSREGVTCSFCHSVTAVNLASSTGRFTNKPARLTRAVEGGDMKGHHVEQHNLSMSSEFCAGCHEWTNGYGLNILSTYSEWQASSYAAEKITCQQCHMPKNLGGGGEPEGSKSAQPTNIHFQMGGHSQDQLVAAARLDVEPVLRDGTIHLDVDLTNSKAGHKLPTGIPNRKLHLHVDLFDREGLLVDSDEIVFGRVIVDESGNVLEDVTDQFLRGARELSDNRIAPKETRRSRFTFPRPPGEEFILAEVSVIYEILTPHLVPPVIRFDVAKKRIPLSPYLLSRTEGPAILPSLAIMLMIFIIVTAIMTALLRRRTGGRDAN